MSQLDQIRKKQLLEAPETITTDWVSPSCSLDNRVGAFSLSFKYINGSAVNMKVYVQLSNDDLEYGELEESEAVITEDTGTVLFDMEGSGAAYIRISIVVTSGSIDAVELRFNASQFH